MVQLTVSEAYRVDVDSNICRIDSDTMDELDIEAGDIVSIKGKKLAGAMVLPLVEQDEGIGIIRMGGVLRFNAGVSLGESVVVEKTEAKHAKTITLSPVEKIVFEGDISEFFKQKLTDKPVMKGNAVAFNVFGNTIYFLVSNSNPEGIVTVSNSTKVIVSDKVQKLAEENATGIRYEDIGGLGDAIQKIREMVELPLKFPQLFQKLGISPPKGVLLYGPPGTGKTLLAKAVANESNANFSVINGPELMSKYHGQSEENIRKVFEEAQENAPSIIFIDEIDAIGSKREEGGEADRKMVSQLLTLMDGLKGRGNIIVIGATNLPDTLDPALRRPGRFDREIRIGIPDEKGRKEILQIHTRGMPLEKDVNIEKFASITHGYTGADLEMLTKEAGMKAIRRVIPKIEKLGDKLSPSILDKMIVNEEDFTKAFGEIDPSGMREVSVEVPNVKWDDVGGLEDVKRKLKEAIELPLKKPKTFERIGIHPPKGILLYGPPGNGKTMLAKAVATESGLNFISIKGPEVLSKWVGESEKAIRDIFKRARDVSPCVIFFDELDSIAPIRGSGGDNNVTERIVSSLLTEIDGIENIKNVIIIGATNRIDMIDPALLRPGRFEKKIFIQAPDETTREEILKIHTRNMPLAKDVNLKELAKETEGYSSAEINAVCREAGMNAIRENDEVKEVSMKDFKLSLNEIMSDKKHLV